MWKRLAIVIASTLLLAGWLRFYSSIATLRVNGIEQRFFNNNKTGKTGSVFQKVKS